MSRHLYKQYVRIASKWPKDAYKNPERDLAVALGRQVEKQFSAELTEPIDTALCERRLRSLEQLYGNEVMNRYKHNYVSGVFGLNLQQLQEASRDENRRYFGLRADEGALKRVFNLVFNRGKKKSAEPRV